MHANECRQQTNGNRILKTGEYCSKQDIIPFGNHPLFRYLVGWATPPKVSFLKLTQPSAVKRLYERHHLLQDMLLPLSTLKETLSFFDSETNVTNFF